MKTMYLVLSALTISWCILRYCTENWRRGGHVAEESKLDNFGHNTTQSLSDRL